MCSGFFKFGDVESGATMTLKVSLLLIILNCFILVIQD